jgi:nicotinic acid phosphoribosyltransferase
VPQTNLVFDLYQLTMAQVYSKYKPQAIATFDLFIRSDKRPFYLTGGIDETLNFLERFRFSLTKFLFMG